ncbi:MAG: hypothetical protein AAFY27_06440, partial [Pseudomonadota bacterium]
MGRKSLIAPGVWLNKTTLSFRSVRPATSDTPPQGKFFVALLAVILCVVSPASGDAQSGLDPVGPECRGIQNQLRQAASNIRRQIRRAERDLRSRRDCSFLLAAFLRQRLDQQSPQARRATTDKIDQLMRDARDEQSDSGPTYLAYLKEAIRLGLDENAASPTWQSNVSQHLQRLQNSETPQELSRFKSEINQRYAAGRLSPFAIASCGSLPDHDRKLEQQLQAGCDNRAKLQQNCRYLENEEDLKTCRAALDLFRQSYPQGINARGFSDIQDRFVEAESRFALRVVASACSPLNGRSSV